MPALQKIMSDSLAETKAIFQWLTERERGQKHPTTVLVGGWAVYTYNPYYGSLDIDLITNSRTRSSLQQYLLKNRGYTWERDPVNDIRYIQKEFRPGEAVEIDFGSRETPNRFEGRVEELPLTLLNENTTYRTIEDIIVPVPTRSLLLLTKMKAAWDRKWRLDNSISREPAWERGKLEKDYSDMLALIDPHKGEDTMDISLLGREINRLDFLKTTLEEARRSADAARKYEITTQQADEMINRLTKLIY